MVVNKKNKNNNLPMILIILDGWGIAKPSKGNAIELAQTPVIDKLSKEYPYTELCASGECVGLPKGQVGNSEAGHMNIGAGRLVKQDVTVINESIADGTFFKNAAFLEAVRHVKKQKSRLHIMGMLSSGSSPHSDPAHIKALISLAKELAIKDIFLHLFTDGRDSPKYASLKLIEELKKQIKNTAVIATIIGRFYAMDRKKKWERTEKTYNALVLGEGKTAISSEAAITESYNRGESDEFIEPCIIFSSENDLKKNKSVSRIEDRDSVIFFNLRSDRARQLAKVFVQKDFNKKNQGAFKRKKTLSNLHFVAMTDFGPDLDSILTAYPSIDLKNTLPIALKEMTQLYIAESEKYAHVTYFFNGGYADPVNGEDRMELPSPDVKSYDETPIMSSNELTEVILKNLKDKKYDFTLLNFAAPDMIGHTGNLNAGIKCCEAVDKDVEKIVKAYLKFNGTIIITADHGNIEEMINLKTDEVDTEHSTSLVPFILVNNDLKNKIKLKQRRFLNDIAPTILDLLEIKKPKEMTGKSLIK
jgi:2,3-bisphosphoglycerate-independent phosphoglycerate mutase